MKVQLRALALTVALLSTGAAVSETVAAPAATAAVMIKEGQMVRSSDGKRIGSIENLTKDSSGAPVAANVIFDERFVAIPASTLTESGNALTTSLSYRDVVKLH